jgi:XTP/dITP diphosphohydrolase
VSPMELIVATGNAHKLVELGPALSGHRLLAPSDIGLGGFDVEEDGERYVDNAVKKARTLYDLCGRPSLADDSGLSVRAMGGEPGVRSARYGSEEGGRRLEAPERNALLLERMRGVADRACAFVCCLVLVLDSERMLVVQETCPGELLDEPRGSGGFGYDPIVFLPGLGKSVAELSLEEKNRLSHRGRACARMAVLLADLETRP